MSILKFLLSGLTVFSALDLEVVVLKRPSTRAQVFLLLAEEEPTEAIASTRLKVAGISINFNVRFCLSEENSLCWDLGTAVTPFGIDLSIYQL